jgi:hypothetical protein
MKNKTNEPTLKHLIAITVIFVAVYILGTIFISIATEPKIPGTCYPDNLIEQKGYCVLYNGTIVRDVMNIDSENYKIVFEDSMIHNVGNSTSGSFR